MAGTAYMVFYRYRASDGENGFSWCQMAPSRIVAVMLATPDAFADTGYKNACPVPPSDACDSAPDSQDIMNNWSEEIGYYEVFHAESNQGTWEIWIQEYIL